MRADEGIDFSDRNRIPRHRYRTDRFRSYFKAAIPSLPIEINVEMNRLTSRCKLISNELKTFLF